MRGPRSGAPLELVRSIAPEPEQEPKEPPKDIYAADSARIAAIDWGAVHIRSDRSPALKLPDRIRRRFRGPGVRRERGALRPEDLA